MKYTVLIRQPITDDVRPELEKHLVESFGLNVTQAQKLAGRRTGRLLKPTSRERAQELLEVYEKVGASVVLQEIDDSGSVTPIPTDTTTPKLATRKQPIDPFATDPFTTRFEPTQDPLTSWTQPSTGPSPDGVFSITDQPDDASILVSQTASPKEVAIAQEIAQASITSITPAADDWASFTGDLKLPEKAPAQEPDSKPNTTEFITAIGATTEEKPRTATKRTSIVTGIMRAAFMPLILSGGLGLIVLMFVLPSAQNSLLAQDARHIAGAIASTVTSNNAAQVGKQLDMVVKNTGLGFVQIGGNGLGNLVRSQNSAHNQALQTKLDQWVVKNPKGGKIVVNDKTYIASRIAVVSDGKGGLKVADATTKEPVLRRVIVGVPTGHTSRTMWISIILIAFSSLIGLGIGVYLARQAAEQILTPLANLVKAAVAISSGELSRAVPQENDDEIGDLAVALEKMRTSLEGAMARLRRNNQKHKRN